MQVYNNKTMWRKLIARAHPDAGGDHELFIFAMKLRDAVCSEELARKTEAEEPARVPFARGQDFAALTRKALNYNAGDYSWILAVLRDCDPAQEGPLFDQQQRGASYKRLAAIAHAHDMTKAERIAWYRVAEAIPLSDRHAGHILSKLKKRAA